jgi:hypothetical protein
MERGEEDATHEKAKSCLLMANQRLKSPESKIGNLRFTPNTVSLIERVEETDLLLHVKRGTPNA